MEAGPCDEERRAAARPGPAIVVIHGGGWIEGDKSSFASREQGVPGNIVDFAALGFVAVTINYRLAGEAPFPGRTRGLQVCGPLAAGTCERLRCRPAQDRCLRQFGRRPPRDVAGNDRTGCGP